MIFKKLREYLEMLCKKCNVSADERGMCRHCGEYCGIRAKVKVSVDKGLEKE